MRPDLQLALIGYGLAGRVFHAPLIQHTPGLVLHSIVSSQRDTLLRAFSDVHVRATPQEVFDDPAVDGVVIATPNEQHASCGSGDGTWGAWTCRRHGGLPTIRDAHDRAPT